MGPTMQGWLKSPSVSSSNPGKAFDRKFRMSFKQDTFKIPAHRMPRSVPFYHQGFSLRLKDSG